MSGDISGFYNLGGCRTQYGFPTQLIGAPNVSGAEEGREACLGEGPVPIHLPDQEFQLDLGTRSTCKSPARAPPQLS